MALVVLLLLPANALCLARDNRAGYLWRAIVDPPARRTIRFPDGHRSLYYRFRLGSGEPDTVIFFFSGSNTESLRYYLKPYLSGLALNATVFALQKRHIGDWGLKGRKGFAEDNHLERWLADDAFFIDQIVRELNPRPARILALGVSEGGNRAVVAAAEHDEITHLVVLAGGGMRQADELKILSRYYGGTPEAFEAKFREIAAEPDRTDKHFLGLPYKYWARVLFFDPLPYYLRLEKPIFYAHGTDDRSTPIESGRALQNRFAEMGRDNLFFLEMQGCGHTFADAGGVSHKPEIFAALKDWLLRTGNAVSTARS